MSASYCLAVTALLLNGMLFCLPVLADNRPAAESGEAGQPADTAMSELSGSFTTDVQPLLSKYCLRCHNGD